jgi:hypothetical protein
LPDEATISLYKGASEENYHVLLITRLRSNHFPLFLIMNKHSHGVVVNLFLSQFLLHMFKSHSRLN